MPLVQALPLYAAWLVARRLAPRTQAEYLRTAAEFVAFLYAPPQVATPRDLVIARLDAFVAALALRGLRPSARRRAVAVVRSFVTFLATAGALPRNPALTLVPPAREPRAVRVLSIDERQRLEHASIGVPRDAALLAVFLHTGLRISEVARLRLGDLTLPRDLFDPPAGILTVHGRGHLERAIPLDAGVCTALLRYRAERSPSASDILFLSQRGRPMTVRGIRFIVMRALAEAGVSGVSVRAFRHSFAVQELQEGVDERVVQSELGHASLDTTRAYWPIAQALTTRESID